MEHDAASGSLVWKFGVRYGWKNEVEEQFETALSNRCYERQKKKKKRRVWVTPVRRQLA